MRPDSWIPVYNLACLEAVTGDPRTAMELLGRAIGKGFGNEDLLKGDEDLVTGIVDLHALAADKADIGNYKVMSTWGKQAMNGEVLGMAVIFPASEFRRFWEAPASGPGIVNTHLVSLALFAGKPTEYAFVAAWELQDYKLKDKEYFNEVINEAAGKLK